MFQGVKGMNYSSKAVECAALQLHIIAGIPWHDFKDVCVHPGDESDHKRHVQQSRGMQSPITNC